MGLLWLTACNSEKTSEENLQEGITEDKPTSSVLRTEDEEVSYTEQLEGGGMSFTISTTGLGEQRNLTILVIRDEQAPTRIDEAIEGTVTKSLVTDLNQNKKPELMIFVTGSGSGSHGKVYGYEFDREYWGELKMPDLSPALQKDYMGHDEFKVVNNRLVRTFPIYLDTDPNCCPTGGKHTVVYKLDDALNLQMEKM